MGFHEVFRVQSGDIADLMRSRCNARALWSTQEGRIPLIRLLFHCWMCTNTKLKSALKPLAQILDLFLCFIIRSYSLYITFICWSKIHDRTEQKCTYLRAIEQELGSFYFGGQTWHDSAIIENQTAVMFSCSTSLWEVLYEAAKLYDMCIGAKLEIDSKSIIDSHITRLILYHDRAHKLRTFKVWSSKIMSFAERMPFPS